MKFEIVVVTSFNSHDTTFASWHIFTCHNALRLFKNSHNTKFRVVAVSLMPHRVVVFFPLNERFRSLSLTYIFCYVSPVTLPICSFYGLPPGGRRRKYTEFWEGLGSIHHINMARKTNTRTFEFNHKVRMWKYWAFMLYPTSSVNWIKDETGNTTAQYFTVKIFQSFNAISSHAFRSNCNKFSDSILLHITKQHTISIW